MRLLRRAHLVRRLLLALAVLAGGLALLVYSRSRERYVPGESTDGIVDTLSSARGAAAGGPAVRLVDATGEAGLVFRHFPARRTNQLPEDMGSGVALGDVDGDGWCDVFLVNEAHALGGAPPASGEGRSALFVNRGDGTFRDASAESGVDFQGLGMAAAFLDADSDGDLDLLLSAWRDLRLYRNEGGARFTDATAEAGLRGLDGFWTGLAVGDYDRDGAVDVYVCGYVVWDEHTPAGSVSQYETDIPASINPSAFEPERNLLLRGLGDGRFEEVAARAGVDNPGGRSLGATFADLDGDGWIDLYVANDVSDNALFVNRGDGTFADLTTAALVGDYRGAMGLAVGDFDRDGRPDLFVTHWVAQENALYQNRTPPAADGGAAPPLFMDVADRFGLGHVALDRVGWATRFFDLDNDGWLDLFVVNGSTIPTEADRTRLEPMRSQLFANLGGSRGFVEVGGTCGEFFREPHVGRGGATFDYDLDGDEDLLVTLHGEGPRLLRNDGGGEAGRVLRVRLRQPSGNRFALGARLELEHGGARVVDQLETQGSYLSQHAVGELAFGLGGSAQVERLRVTWPDGVVEERGPLPADRLVTWVRGEEPRVEELPGRRARARGALSVEDRRAFFDLLGQAGRRRLAGECQAAIELYERALALDPAHSDALYYRANCYLELGDPERALAAFEALVRDDPRSSRAWMQLGNLLVRRRPRGADDLERAGAAFERAHAINGEESLPVVRMGLVALLRGDLAGADGLLETALQAHPGSTEALWLRGRIAWQRGERERAQAFLELAREAAGSAPPGARSASNEGDTRTGGALLAGAAGDPASDLDRWRTLLERPADASAEYSAPPP